MFRPHRMTGTALVALALTLSAHAALAADAAELAARVVKAREVYQDLAKTADRGVPEALEKDCKCIAVFPRVLKLAVGIGGRAGNGVITCRNAEGTWSPLAFFRLTGGSWGLQLGAEATEVVLFFMTESGARSLLESKFTLGGKASVAAGPVGRSAEAGTDVKLNAEIYSYARSKGLFAGLSLEGARLAPDKDDINRYYGQPTTAKALLFDHTAPKRPAEMEEFLKQLP